MIRKIQPTEFPPLLREIKKPPKALFIEGGLPPDDKYIAVVGTRKPSPYGKKMTVRIVQELSQLGMTIVSGLAVGIDTYAHETALSSNAKTVAVLGSGLGRIYPPENRVLARRITRNGALVSEYEENMSPLYFNFPERNRIISGMSIATIVIEAGEKSGALITAKGAINEGREVFAVPGDIDRPQAKGTLMLLKEGAHPFTDTQDLLENLNIQTDLITHIKRNKIKSLTDQEKQIMDAIPEGSLTTIEKIIKKSPFHISKLHGILSILEIRGLIERTNTGTYMRL